MSGSETYAVDACVIGAGAVGLASAWTLARRGRSVAVVERDARIGAGVSSRNSEVIHAGLHYAPGSLKARFCVAGRRLLYDFLESRRIAFDKCGKLIVATVDEEMEAIAALAARGAANGVEGVSAVGGEAARALEPELRAAGALLSTESGILDAHGFMAALAGEIEAAGGIVALSTPFLSATPTREGLSVRCGGAEPFTLAARTLVIAAGLQAQTCAARVEGFPADRLPPLHFGKGSYFALTGRAPFRRLIYPPPIPGALGIHYRRDLGGQARFGPDLQFVEAEDYTVDPGRAAGFEAYVRRFWPGLPAGALTPDYAGIRPKLHGPGEPQGDFVIDDDAVPGVIALFGIESPGLTSSLAIGEDVADRIEHRERQ